MKIVSDVLLLSYLDKFGLSVTVEAGQALAVLYSGARLYKGPSLAGLPRGEARTARISCHSHQPNKLAKERGEGGVNRGLI